MSHVICVPKKVPILFGYYKRKTLQCKNFSATEHLRFITKYCMHCITNGNHFFNGLVSIATQGMNPIRILHRDPGNETDLITAL